MDVLSVIIRLMDPIKKIMYWFVVQGGAPHTIKWRKRGPRFQMRQNNQSIYIYIYICKYSINISEWVNGTRLPLWMSFPVSIVLWLGFHWRNQKPTFSFLGILSICSNWRFPHPTPPPPSERYHRDTDNNSLKRAGLLYRFQGVTSVSRSGRTSMIIDPLKTSAACFGYTCPNSWHWLDCRELVSVYSKNC